MPKLTIPTGYEAELRKAESKRKIAEALLQMGMQGSGQAYGSWLQPIAQMAQAFAGKRLQHKADELDADVSTKMRDAYSKGIAGIAADAKAGMTPDQIVAKYSGDSLLADAVKPYQEAMTTALKERENLTRVGPKVVRMGDYASGQNLPNDMNQPVIYGPNGEAIVNPVRRTAALQAQGYSPNGQGLPSVESMQDPATGGAPPVGGPALTVPTPEAQSPVPAASTPDPATIRSFMQGIINHARQNGAQITSVDRTPEHNRAVGGVNNSYHLRGEAFDSVPPKGMSMGAWQNELRGQMPGWDVLNEGDHIHAEPGPGHSWRMGSGGGNSMKPPSGVVNGKPYWMINGVPYDNPEGN